MYPDLPLPSAPIYVRWTTWLEAVNFYEEKFDKIKDVVNSLNTAEAKAVETAQLLLSKKEIVGDLAYISANFTFLAGLLGYSGY